MAEWKRFKHDILNEHIEKRNKEILFPSRISEADRLREKLLRDHPNRWRRFVNGEGTELAKAWEYWIANH